MNLGLSDDPVTSFRMFQSRVLNEYDLLTDEFGLTVIDGRSPIDKQQELVREIVRKELVNYDKYHQPMEISQSHTEMSIQGP